MRRLGVKIKGRSKGQYISHLYQALLDYYSRDVNVVLIIDEAHRLRPDLLEEVRLLTNLETPKGKLLQVILVGQPELNETLNRHEFRQLKQRISLRYHFRVLTKTETQYIQNRLQKAGLMDPRVFSPKALEQIFEYSQGIPRLINIVCDNALISGYASDLELSTRKLSRKLSLVEKGRYPRKVATWFLRMIVLAVLALLVVLLGWNGLKITNYLIFIKLYLMNDRFNSKNTKGISL